MARCYQNLHTLKSCRDMKTRPKRWSEMCSKTHGLEILETDLAILHHKGSCSVAVEGRAAAHVGETGCCYK